MPNPGTIPEYTTNPELAKVGVRLPPFSAEDPACFGGHNGGFYKILLCIDASKEVKDVITNPPAENKYQKLKTELIKRLSASQKKKGYTRGTR